MINYNEGKIYKLVSPNGKIYIGSTCKNLKLRLAGHKGAYLFNKKHNKNKNLSSFKIFDDIDDINNVEIELIENFPCENITDLQKRERYHIEQIECVNKNIPTRTKKEYNETIITPEIRHKYNSTFYKKNQNKLKEQTKCECGGLYRLYNRSHHMKTSKHVKFLQIVKPENIIIQEKELEYKFIIEDHNKFRLVKINEDL